MDLKLDGRVALVTGGSRGIGRAVAEGLAREGCKVAVLARTAADVARVAEELSSRGAEALPLPADVADADAVERALSTLRARFGAPTIVVHAAAAHYRIQKLHTVTPEAAAEWLATDLAAAVDLSRRTVADMMLEGFGRQLFIGSVAARAGVAGGTLYATAKAGLEGLARGLSVDYARRGITANVVSVSFADTERLARRTASDPQARERLARATATRAIPTPAEIADVVCFVASPRAGSITGAVIDATAGAHLNNLW